MTITIPDDLAERLTQESNGLKKTVEERLADILDKSLAPQKNFDQEHFAVVGMRRGFVFSLPTIEVRTPRSSHSHTLSLVVGTQHHQAKRHTNNGANSATSQSFAPLAVSL